jgi:Glycosyl transferases group 1
MKIAFIHNDIPPYRIDFFNKINKLYTCDIFLTIKNESFRKWDKANIGNASYIIKKFFGIYFSIRILYILKKQQYSHVVLVDSLPFLFFNILILSIFKNSKTKFIILSGINKDAYRNFRIRYFPIFIFHILFKNCIYSVFAYSLKSKSYFNNLGYGRVYQSSQLIDYDIQCLNRPLNKINVVHLCFIGYLRNRPNKGLDLLIDFVRLNNKYQLHVIGDGPLLPYFKKYSKGLNNICWYGYKDKLDKIEIICKSDLVVIPTKSFEPWNWVLPECLALGVNVCVSDLVSSNQLFENDFSEFTFKPNLASLTNYILSYKLKEPKIMNKYILNKGLSESILSFNKCL